LTVGATLLSWRQYDAVILASACATVFIGARAMLPIMRQPRGRYRDQPWRPILTNGTHSFMQAVLQMAQPMIAYAIVRWRGGDSRDVGFLHAGLFLIQGLTVPLTMVAPLLFARWTANDDIRLLERLSAWTFRLLLVGAALGVALALSADRVIPLLFGREYVMAAASAKAMLLTLPIVCHVRLIAPALHSRGHPGINTCAGLVRMTAFAAGAVLLSPSVESLLLSVGAAWAIAEVLASAWTFVGLRYALANESARATVG
jgi:O-antigen/teichoic acid export membrane protein